MARKETIVVFDLGASGGRLFTATRQGGYIAFKEIHRFAHQPVRFWRNDRVTRKSQGSPCWNVAGIWNDLQTGLRKVAGRKDLHVVSLGIDTWGSDGVWLTRRGEMLHPVATGRDLRWKEAQRMIRKSINDKELFHRTGMPSHAFNVLNQVYWYAHYQPGLVEAAACYLPMPSLLNYFLTGKSVAEHTWMSVSQLCRAGKMEYDRSLFKRLQLPLAKMPPLVAPGTSLGLCHQELVRELGIAPFPVVVPASHDTACAYHTAPVNSRKPALVVSSGTWFLVGVMLQKPILTREAWCHGFANEGGVDGMRFLKNIIGTWPLQELRRLWEIEDGKALAWREIDRLAQSARPFGCALDLSDPRIFAPADMARTLQTLGGELGRKPSNRARMVRAVYEGLAALVADTARRVERLAGLRLGEVVLLGGASQSSLLGQWLADACQLPVRAMFPNATACGNALIQAQAQGWIRSTAEGRTMLQPQSREKIFHPRDETPWRELRQRLNQGGLRG